MISYLTLVPQITWNLHNSSQFSYTSIFVSMPSCSLAQPRRHLGPAPASSSPSQVKSFRCQDHSSEAKRLVKWGFPKSGYPKSTHGDLDNPMTEETSKCGKSTATRSFRLWFLWHVMRFFFESIFRIIHVIYDVRVGLEFDGGSGLVESSSVFAIINKYIYIYECMYVCMYIYIYMYMYIEHTR
jgi:hypothetical protein